MMNERRKAAIERMVRNYYAQKQIVEVEITLQEYLEGCHCTEGEIEFAKTITRPL